MQVCGLFLAFLTSAAAAPCISSHLTAWLLAFEFQLDHMAHMDHMAHHEIFALPAPHRFS